MEDLFNWFKKRLNNKSWEVNNKPHIQDFLPVLVEFFPVAMAISENGSFV